VPETKIKDIPHGFRLGIFKDVPSERIDAIREKYGIPAAAPVIGVISRFTEWKGVQYIVPAFSSLLADHPSAILLLLNAGGDYAEEIETLLKPLPAQNYRMIPFERDIAAALHVMTAFVHTPVDEHSEAFGQIYVEALAAGVPSVFTLSGIAPDFIRDGHNALVVPFRDSEAICKALQRLFRDKTLRDILKAEGWNSVKDRFALQKMINRMGEIYEAR
jgi:glycosyltransferase involved in cell wall biosynthesis